MSDENFSTRVVKRGVSIEITDQLILESAERFAQWIGSYTVIYNQKTIASQAAYREWCDAEKPSDTRPSINAKAAHIAKQDGFDFLGEVPAHIRRNAGAKWFEAMNAGLTGVRKPPRIKPKHKRRNCYVTNELFVVAPLDDERCVIQFKVDGTKKNAGQFFFGCVMPFSAKDAGRSLYLSRQGRRFWVSMAYDVETDAPTEQELRERLHAIDRATLEDVVTGYDIGVVRQVTGSDKAVYHLDDKAQEKLEETERKRIKHQKRYSRIARANDRIARTNKRPRTNGEKRQAGKIAHAAEKRAGIWFNASHHISKGIAEQTPMVAVFEDINLQNLTRRPKAKQNPDTGRWLPNGARAKAGLNKSILNLNLGQIRMFSEYKLADRGKLLIKTPAPYSSQECRVCGYTNKDNRNTQSEFHCLNCGHTENADENAAGVHKKRGIALIESDTFTHVKTARQVSVRRSSTGRETASLERGGRVSRESIPPCPSMPQNSSLADV